MDATLLGVGLVVGFFFGGVLGYLFGVQRATTTMPPTHTGDDEDDGDSDEWDDDEPPTNWRELERDLEELRERYVALGVPRSDKQRELGLL